MLKQMLYFDVILRTSIFPAVLGAMIAIYAGVADMSLNSIISWILCLLGIILVQGVIQHGQDILMDKGGFSAFRMEVDEEVERKIKGAIKKAMIVLGIIAALLVYFWRLWLIPIGVLAVRSAKLYNETHNEWYSVFGFMLSFSVGYFAFTNYPTTAWVIGAMITGFIMRSSQAMYRLDDYLEKEFQNTLQIIQYYRNIFRNTIHIVPILVVALLLYFTSSVGSSIFDVNTYLTFAIYIAGISVFGIQTLRLKDKVRQEVNLAPMIVAIVTVEVIAVYLNLGHLQITKILLYLASVIIMSWALQRFWKRRHSMCNILYCTENPLRTIERPK